MTFEDNEENISGIYNYCDRWCERCAFTARCMTYQMEQEYAIDEDSDDPMRDALNVVGAAFADAKRMLIEKAEEMGIDLDEAMNDPEIDEDIARADNWVESKPAVELGKRYALGVTKFLDRVDEWLPQSDDPMAVEMFRVVQWFHFMVAVQIHSSYRALLDWDGYEDPEALADTQSHANGTAKNTLISIDRSINAWKYLSEVGDAAQIQPWLSLLEEIKPLMEEKFPNAYEFVRPGFDEIETVM
ncbi:MAG: hypothetical protein KF855_05855 [Acidobacteria bacterium]|nr:hypothetical protein [Acidobacteriota bacterium]